MGHLSGAGHSLSRGRPREEGFAGVGLCWIDRLKAFLNWFKDAIPGCSAPKMMDSAPKALLSSDGGTSIYSIVSTPLYFPDL